MPRRSGGGGGRAPSRPTAAPARSAPAPQQQRKSSTAAYPPARTQQGQQSQAPPQQQQSPGLFGQMASTAAGVAVGSSIGHAVGNFFGGGSSAPAEAEQADMSSSQAQDGQYNTQRNAWGEPSCEMDAKNFTQCLDDNGGNMQICSWYLEQLKACQSAARGF